MASKELPMQTAARKLVLVFLLVGLSAIFATPGAGQAATVVIKLNGSQVFSRSCSTPSCFIRLTGSTGAPLILSASNGKIRITDNSSTDFARVQLTAGSTTFFMKITGTVATALTPTGTTTVGTIPSPGLTLEISVTNTEGEFGTVTGGTKAYACSLSGFWNRSIASSGDNFVTQTCSAKNTSGSFASINSILSFVTLTSSATSFAPTQETLSQACGTSGQLNCQPAMNVVFKAKFTRYGDIAKVPTSSDSGASADNVEDEALLDLNIAQGKPGVVTWPAPETVRVKFTQPISSNESRPNPPGPNIPVKVERLQACSAFDPKLDNCPTGDQSFTMVSDTTNNLFGGTETPLPWVRSDDRSFVGTPFSGKVSDITVLKAQGTADENAPLGTGSLYFSLKGPGKTELIRIHLGGFPPFTGGYDVGPTASPPTTPPQCGGQNVIGLNEARYEINPGTASAEFVTYNQLGNLKNQRLESVSLVLAPFEDLRQIFELKCFELDTRTTVVKFIPFENEGFAPTCTIESEPGRAKVLVTRAADPDFFELVDMNAQTCRWEGAVTIASGEPDTYTFTFILDDQPRHEIRDVTFGL